MNLLIGYSLQVLEVIGYMDIHMGVEVTVKEDGKFQVSDLDI